MSGTNECTHEETLTTCDGSEHTTSCSSCGAMWFEQCDEAGTFGEALQDA